MRDIDNTKSSEDFHKIQNKENNDNNKENNNKKNK